MSDTPSVVSMHELVVNYGHHEVLRGLTLAVHQGERIGLVGRNGCGKSTLLKIIASVEQPDSGDITYRKDTVIGYLSQEFTLNEEMSVLENVMDGASQILALIDQYENEPADSLLSAQLLERINQLDGWNLENRAQTLLTNLHAPDPDKPITKLSGGERRRVALCRALIAQPDLLILDEPTNHLDTESITWLEKFLSRYKGTCLFVTHDRYFLDLVSTQIVEIHAGISHSYNGSYTDYLLERAERMAVEAQQESKRQKFLKKELEWVRRSPSARRGKSKDRIDKFFEIKSQKAPEKELQVDLIIPPAPKLGDRVIELKNTSKAYGEKNLFYDLSFKLGPKERVGIIGRNGLGKSTLLKVMLGMEDPDSGEVIIGNRAEINYVDQNRLQLDYTKSVFDEVGEGQEYVTLGEEKLGLRAYLKRFLFSDDRINTRVELLSGGERSRVLLAKILKRGGNVLVLDEPTNDLDLSTLRLLEEAIENFSGSVIAVSHDRYFLNRVCTNILSFEGRGIVDYHVGNFDYYLEKKQENTPKATTQKATAKPAIAQKPKEVRKLKWKEERELEGMEDTILEKEGAIEALETLFSASDFHEKHADDWQELEEKLNETRDEVKRLYDRWEELESIKQTSQSK